jgi:hypothetical protein
LSKDDGKSRKLVRDLLTFRGYEIIEAETGKRVSSSPKHAARA